MAGILPLAMTTTAPSDGAAPPARLPMTHDLREGPVGLLSALVCTVFALPLLLGETLFFRDLTLYSLPQRMLVARELRAGHLPLWDAFLHGGQPLLGSPNNSVLYPGNLLYLIMPDLTAFNLEIVLHLWLAALFTYLLARTIGLTKTGACIAAVAFSFSGVALSLVNLFRLFLGLPYLPALLLFWHLTITEGKRRFFVLSVLAGVLPVLAGAPEIALMAFATLVFWTVAVRSSWTTRTLGLGLLVALGLFSLGLGMIQIIPTTDLLSATRRGEGMTEAIVGEWSLHPKRLVELVFPGVMGPTDSFLPTEYWGGILDDNGFPYILSITLGGTVLLFASLGAFARIEGRLVRGARGALLALVACGFTVALGRHVALFGLAYRLLPFLRIFRFPMKALVLVLIPCAILCGLGVETAAESAWPRRLSGLAAGILGMMTIALSVSAGFARSVQMFLFGTASEHVRLGLVASAWHTTAFVSLVALTLGLTRILTPRARVTLLGFLVAADVVVATRPVNPTADRRFLTGVPDLVPLVESELRGGRLFRDSREQQWRLNRPDTSVIWRERFKLDALVGYAAARYEIPVVFHDDFDGLAQKRIMQLRQLVDISPWPRRLSLLAVAGVTTILTSDTPLATGLPPIVTTGDRFGPPLFLYSNPRSSGTTPSFASDWVWVPAGKPVLLEMIRPDFDPERRVILESRPAFGVPASHCEARVERATGAGLRVVNPCNGYLVFKDPYFPDRRVRVDGADTPVARANFAFGAIPLAAGVHVVTSEYGRRRFLYGLLASALAGSLLALFLMSRRVWARPPV